MTTNELNKTYKVVKSFDVQVTYELDAKTEEEAEENTDPKYATNENWEYIEIIETEEIK
tara:strand:+ start:18 stop:194 length:177 start_codon:yes stop_codon:yes gene_type:complete